MKGAVCEKSRRNAQAVPEMGNGWMDFPWAPKWDRSLKSGPGPPDQRRRMIGQCDTNQSESRRRKKNRGTLQGIRAQMKQKSVRKKAKHQKVENLQLENEVIVKLQLERAALLSANNELVARLQAGEEEIGKLQVALERVEVAENLSGQDKMEDETDEEPKTNQETPTGDIVKEEKEVEGTGGNGQDERAPRDSEGEAKVPRKRLTIEEVKERVQRAKGFIGRVTGVLASIHVKGIPRDKSMETRNLIASMGIPVGRIEDISFAREDVAVLVVRERNYKTVVEKIRENADLETLVEFNPLASMFNPGKGETRKGIEGFKIRIKGSLRYARQRQAEGLVEYLEMQLEAVEKGGFMALKPILYPEYTYPATEAVPMVQTVDEIGGSDGYPGRTQQ